MAARTPLNKHAVRRSKVVARRVPSIHPSIKRRLGYADQPDTEVWKDWKERLRRVCKPCWELKYCPYGPLVEQSPILPSPRSEAAEHIEYLRKCVDTGLVGQVSDVDEASRRNYQEWLADDGILVAQVIHEIAAERWTTIAAASPDPLEAFMDRFVGPLPPIQEYRVSYNLPQAPRHIRDVPKEDRALVRKKLAARKRKLAEALETGISDDRRPIDPARRAWFQQSVDDFKPDDHPESVLRPSLTRNAISLVTSVQCISQLRDYRRPAPNVGEGRYIPFTVKVRVVRRDNYTCQHCGEHLKDDEVEFDHIIPVSKGGSSEEHNIRLTCYVCNQDKKDSVAI